VGFDGLNNFRGMLSQVAAKQSAARVVITRHARENIPSGVDFVAWLDAQWLEMDRKLSEIMLLAKSRVNPLQCFIVGLLSDTDSNSFHHLG
jgi:hypothetical protein